MSFVNDGFIRLHILLISELAHVTCIATNKIIIPKHSSPISQIYFVRLSVTKYKVFITMTIPIQSTAMPCRFLFVNVHSHKYYYI